MKSAYIIRSTNNPVFPLRGHTRGTIIPVNPSWETSRTNKMFFIIYIFYHIIVFPRFGQSLVSLRDYDHKEQTRLACESIAYDGVTTITRNQSNYEAESEVNWSQTAWLHPTCIVLPANATEVSSVIRTIKRFQVKFAVRSGGHSWNTGFSNVENGVLISLEAINQISLNKNVRTARIVSIGPGLRWGEVYTALAPEGLALVGGNIPDVGVGGLIVGGGLSWLSSSYGLACDNVANFEVVLADGPIINANLPETPDLFWALKGGSSNFGIVTRYDIFAHPISQVWVAILTYTEAQCAAGIRAFSRYQIENTVPGDLASFDITLNGCEVGLFSPIPRATQPSFTEFLKSTENVTSVIQNITFTDLVNSLGSTLFPSNHIREEFRAVSTRVNTSVEELAAFYEEVRATFKNIALPLSGDAPNISLALQPMRQSTIDAGKRAGENALGLTHALTCMALYVGWESAEADDAIHSTARGLVDTINSIAASYQLQDRFIYLNDAAGDQPIFKGYGEKNRARLHGVAKRYDPDGLFQALQNRGFLVSQS